MMAGGMGINVGGIYADLEIRSGNLDRGLAKGRAAMAAIDREVKQLKTDFDGGAVGIQTYTDRLNALIATQTELAKRMRDAYGATRTLNTGLELVTKNSNAMVHASNRMGQGMLQLGYIADDLQYGFSGVVNNVAPLVHGLGGPAGLAAALQVVVVVGYQLYRNWDLLMDTMELGTVRTEAEEMDALAKATSRTADEQERLNKYKEKHAAIDRMLGGKSKEAVETDRVVQDIFNEADPNKIKGTLAAQMKPELSPDDKVEGARAYKRVVNAAKQFGEGSPELEKAAKAFHDLDAKLAKKLDDEGLARAEDLMLAAKGSGPEGEQARKSISTKLGRLDEGNPLAGLIDQLAPENIDTLVNKKDKDRDREKEIGRPAFLEEQATKRKLTPGEGAELARLLQADVDKQNREEIQADEEKAREAKQLDRENLQAGMAAAPGDIKAQAATAVMQESAGMIAPGAAFGRIQKAIEDNGATTEQAIAATKEIESDAQKDMEKGITDRLMNPTAQEQRKQSQVFDATSLAAQFQSSVGGDETKKQTTLLEKLEKTVDALAKGGKLVKIK